MPMSSEKRWLCWERSVARLRAMSGFMHRRAGDMELILNREIIRRDLAGQGFVWIPRSAWSLGPRWEPHWQRLCADWDNLELDLYLAEGAKFRLRRYVRFYSSPA